MAIAIYKSNFILYFNRIVANWQAGSRMCSSNWNFCLPYTETFRPTVIILREKKLLTEENGKIGGGGNWWSRNASNRVVFLFQLQMKLSSFCELSYDNIIRVWMHTEIKSWICPHSSLYLIVTQPAVFASRIIPFRLS